MGSAIGQSATPDMNTKAEADHLAYDFQRTVLSEAQLQLFERQAQQKVQDLFDYLSLLTDDSLDQELREYAHEQVLELFHDHTAKVPGLAIATFSADHLPEYLNLLQQNSRKEHIKITWEVISLRQNQSFTPENLIYTGQIQANVRVEIRDKNHQPQMEEIEVLIDINLSFKTKSFGKDQLRVWEVFLGEIH